MKRLLFIVVVSAVGIPAWTRGVVLLLVEDAGGRFRPMVPERAHATLFDVEVAQRLCQPIVNFSCHTLPLLEHSERPRVAE